MKEGYFFIKINSLIISLYKTNDGVVAQLTLTIMAQLTPMSSITVSYCNMRIVIHKSYMLNESLYIMF